MRKVIDKRKLLGGIFGSLLFAVCVIGFTFAWYSWRSNEEQDVAVGFTIGEEDSEFCIAYQDGGTITGVLNESNNYTTSGTFTFYKTCDDLLLGHVYLNVNDFSATALVREKALKWAIYEGNIIDPEKLINTGNFNGEAVSTSENKIPLDINIEMSKDMTQYTVAIYLDMDELDKTYADLPNIKTEVNVEASYGTALEGETTITGGLYDSLYVNSIANSGYVISATAKDFKYDINGFQLTTGTESGSSISCESPSGTWQSLTAGSEQSITYDVDSDGVYCVWFKNTNNATASKGIVIDTTDNDVSEDESAVVITLGDMNRTKFNADSRIAIPLIINSTKGIDDGLSADEIEVLVGGGLVSDVTKTIEISDNNDKFYTLILEDLVLADNANRGVLSLSIGNGKVVNEDNASNSATTLTVGTYDDIKPICTFGTIPSNVSKGVDFTVDIQCTDSISGMVWSGLTIDRLTTKDNDLKIVSVSTPTAIENGYNYTVTLNTNTLKEDGYNLTLKADSVWDKSGNYNNEVTSNIITTQTAPTYTVTFQAGSNVSSIGETSLTCTPTGSSNTCEVIAPSITANDGYDVLGWGLEGNTKVYILPGDTITVGANVVYVATARDIEKPVCTFETISTIQYGNTTNVNVSCVDNIGVNQTTLSASNFKINNTDVAQVSSVSDPVADGNGYKYTITIESVGAGTYTLSINSGSVSDAANNLNDVAYVNGIINQRPVTYTADSATKDYDGTELTAQSATLTSGSLASGDVATFTIVGSITEVGSVTNILESVTIMRGDIDVTGGYNITKVDGTLTINSVGIEKPTNAYCLDAAPIYDGTEQVITKSAGAGFTFSGNTGINAGSYTVTATLNDNYNWADNTTDAVTFECSIAKRAVTYTADSASKEYDGEALTAQSATLTSGTLASGHTATFSITGSITDAGSVANTLDSVTIMSNDVDVSSNYDVTMANGTLTVTRKKIEKPTNAYCLTLTYDGTSQVLTSDAGTGFTFTNNQGVAAANYTVVATLDGNYQWSDNTTTNSSFECSIAKRTVTYTAVSDSKIYDGEALTGQSATLTSGTLASDHTATFLITGSITNVGSVTNTLSNVIINAGGTDVTDNYDVTKINGSLEVTQRPITITANNQTIVEGESIVNNISQVTVGGDYGLVNGHSLSSITLEADTDNMKVVASEAVIEDASDNNVTSNYNVTYVEGALSYKSGSYTIEYYLGNNSETAGATKIGNSTCTIDNYCALSSWSSLSAIIPNSISGWTFSGWSSIDGTSDTSITYEDGASVNNLSTTNGAVVKIYAILERTITFYSSYENGVANTGVQYWNPYSIDESYYTANDVPTPAAMAPAWQWNYTGISNSSTALTVDYASDVTSVKTSVSANPIWYTIYNRTLTLRFNANGGVGSIDNLTDTQYYNSNGEISTSNFTLPSGTFTKTGWTFSCWTRSSTDDSETCYNEESTYVFSPIIHSATIDITFYAKWQATGTFYYFNDGIETVTASCSTVLSTCSATVPTAVIESTGQYNNSYAGLATTMGTMDVNVSSGLTSVSLSGAVNYYSVYRGNINLRYPSSDTECSSVAGNLFRNSYFTSVDKISTVISDSYTGTTNAITFNNIPSGTILKGFTTTVNSADVMDIANLVNSDVIEIYAILNKPITLTFYYNNYSVDTPLNVQTATQSYNRDSYCTSVTESTLGDATFGSIPEAVSNSKGPYNNSFSGRLANGTGTMSGNGSLSTLQTTYFALYSETVTRKYYNSTTLVWTTENIYRNSWFTSHSTMETILSISDTSVDGVDYSSETGPGGAAFVGLSQGDDEDTAGIVEYANANSAAAYTTINNFVTIYKVYSVGDETDTENCVETLYANTLEHSVNIATSGNTICPLVNNTDASQPSITADTTLTLDLNEKTISKTTNNITNAGTFTIRGTSGTLLGTGVTCDASTLGCFDGVHLIVNNGGILNIGEENYTGFSINRDKSCVGDCDGDAEGVLDDLKFVISSSNILNIVGGTITANDRAVYARDTVNISGGTVFVDGTGSETGQGGYFALYLFNDANVTMTGGTLKCNQGWTLSSSAELNISYNMSGGTVEGYGGLNFGNSTIDFDMTGGRITTVPVAANDIAIKAAYGIYSGGSGDITINGGSVYGSGTTENNASSNPLIALVGGSTNLTLTGASKLYSYGQNAIYAANAYSGKITISATPFGTAYSSANANITTQYGVAKSLIYLNSTYAYGTNNILEMTSGYIYAYHNCINQVGTGGILLKDGSIFTTAASDDVSSNYAVRLAGSGTTQIGSGSYNKPLIWNQGSASAVYVASAHTGTLNVTGGLIYSAGSTSTIGTLGSAGNGLSIYGGTVNLTKGYFESLNGRGVQISGSGTLNINTDSARGYNTGSYIASKTKGGLFVNSGSNVKVVVGHTSGTKDHAPTFMTGDSDMYALAGAGSTKSVTLRSGRFFTADNNDNNMNWDNSIVTASCSATSGSTQTTAASWSGGAGANGLNIDSNFVIPYTAWKYCVN